MKRNMLTKKGATNTDRIMMILEKNEPLRIEMNNTLQVKIVSGEELSAKPDMHLETATNFLEIIKFKTGDFNEGN